MTVAFGCVARIAEVRRPRATSAFLLRKGTNPRQAFAKQNLPLHRRYAFMSSTREMVRALKETTMPNAPEPERDREEPQDDAVHAEAEIRAHDRLRPDSILDAFTAVDVYVEAFVTGARYADQQRGASR